MAEALKAENPAVMVGSVGPKVAVQPERSLQASTAIDFVAREEFDFTIAEVAEGRPLASVAGISFKDPNGRVIRNPDRELVADMDRLPFVTRSTSGTCAPRTTTSATCCTRTSRLTPGEGGHLGLTWSCNAKANVPWDTLKVLKDNGLRLLLVGYESSQVEAAGIRYRMGAMGQLAPPPQS